MTNKRDLEFKLSNLVSRARNDISIAKVMEIGGITDKCNDIQHQINMLKGQIVVPPRFIIDNIIDEFFDFADNVNSYDFDDLDHNERIAFINRMIRKLKIVRKYIDRIT